MTSRDELATLRHRLRVKLQHAYDRDWPEKRHAPFLGIERYELVSLLDEIDRLEKIVEAMAAENSVL
jgi:hypothetical protein